jgi:AcrR family transcriptional regulator
MFADRPLDELKIEDVAREAGISRGLLFYYFPTKRAYYMAVVEAAARRVVRLMSVPPELEGAQALRYALTSYFDLVERRTDAYALLARSAVSADPDVAAIWEGARGQLTGAMLEAIGADDQHTRILVRGWQAMMESIALDWARDHPADRDVLIEELVSTLEELLARRAQS